MALQKFKRPAHRPSMPAAVSIWGLCARSRNWARATQCSRPCRSCAMTARCWGCRGVWGWGGGGVGDGGRVRGLGGDVPLPRADTLRALVALVAAGQGGQGGQLALLTVTLPDPAGYGRIVRSVSG